jgi:ketopantoate reductase
VVDEDVLLSMWRKLTVMAAYSTVTAVARCSIGPIVAAPDACNTLLQARFADVRACPDARTR